MRRLLSKIMLTCIMLVNIAGCKTIGKHYMKHPVTGKLELVEKIEMRGTAKHKIEFETGGKAEADSGFRVPDFKVDKIFDE